MPLSTCHKITQMTLVRWVSSIGVKQLYLHGQMLHGKSLEDLPNVLHATGAELASSLASYNKIIMKSTTHEVSL